MKYAIVYASKTGNTKVLANTIQACLPTDCLVYHGEASEDAKQADMIFVGFWTDKGTCDEATQKLLKTLHNKQVFLFGTAGFGGDVSYFIQIIDRVKQHVSEDNTLLGSYMCQGKMPQVVRDRYVTMAKDNPKMNGMIENFDKALSHPDNEDITLLQEAIFKMVK